jgi:sterol desaturase/sphingolipid hydroxylase (fatty acid hydroxylase superfamily)
VRFACFGGVLAAMWLWEALAPRRPLTHGRPVRWFSNLGIVAVDTVCVRLLVPLSAVGLALFAEERGWGIVNNVALPAWLAVLLAVIALDLVIYLQHVMFHAVPLLWRLHMVHHADLDFDATTGVRFHPVEVLLSLGIKLGAVMLLGASALAVVLFEVLLNATSMFNHGNVRIPGWLDRVLRLVLVTPEMHRVHHSVLSEETNSNFGFNLSWWDFLLGTYRSQPRAGHEAMNIGLTQFQDERVEQLPWMLALPFIGKVGEYPVNRSHEESAAKAGGVTPSNAARTPPTRREPVFAAATEPHHE